MTFMIIVVINTILGIFQQIRAKRAVDKLTLVAAHKVRVLRSGKWIKPVTEAGQAALLQFHAELADLHGKAE